MGATTCLAPRTPPHSWRCSPSCKVACSAPTSIHHTRHLHICGSAVPAARSLATPRADRMYMSEAKADGQCVIASLQLLQGGRRCGMNVVTLIRTCRSKRQKGRKVQETMHRCKGQLQLLRPIPGFCEHGRPAACVQIRSIVSVKSFQKSRADVQSSARHTMLGHHNV